MEREVTTVDVYGFMAEGLTFSAEELTLLIPVYREKIANNGIENERVKEIDREIFLNIKNLPDFWEDNEAEPISKWWWHLRKIKEGTYPAELLPEYLREIYLKSLQKG
jgi:hypothetical protein